MPNDFSSLRSSPRRSAPLFSLRSRLGARRFEGTSELAKRAGWAALAALTCIALPSCGGEEDTSITYNDDVRPIFNRRCTTCHYASTPIGVNIENPFSAENGLVNAKNSWAIEAPGQTDEYNVVPGDPDASFLMDKITGNLPVEAGGSPMPYQVPPLDEEQIGILEKWVADGANNDQFFAQNVRPIFGSEESAGAYYQGRCIYCHYEGSPNPLNLSDPFGPDGLVEVPASFRGDMLRVVPGDPEESLLILKVRAQRPEGDIGAQMPYSFTELTTRQIGIVRQWIAEGAKP